MYRPTKSARIFAVAVLMTPACFAQSGIVPTPLRIVEETPLPALVSNLKGWRVSVGDGEFFVQTGDKKYAAVDSDGQVRTALDVSMVPATDSMNPRDLFLLDVTQDPRGGVIAPVWWNEASRKKMRSGILRFAENGDYNSLLWLDAGFLATHVAEFSSSGDFLVTGYDDHGKTYTALFDFQGKMLIPHVLSLGPTEEPARKQASPQTEKSIQESALDASLIQLASGDDDAVYVYDPSKGRKVFRVLPSGKSTEIALPKPTFLERANSFPLEMFVSHSSIYLNEAILKAGQKTEKVTELKRFGISVYDRYTGELSSAFQIDGTYGGTPVALSPKEFSFLNVKVSPGGMLNFSIIRARP